MNKASDRLAVRPMRRKEMDWAIERAAAEGWNPGLHDSSCFFDTDPEAFLIGTLRGAPVGCISAVSYGENFGFIGFYIVVPELRGRGYGLSLWNGAMDRLKGRNIGLDGVIGQQQSYRRSGFRLAYRNIRYQGRPAGSARGERNLLPLEDVPRDLVERYDLLCFPGPRKRFLDGWLSMPESRGVACMEGGKPAGYGVIRKCRRGYKIGPLFADDPDRAEAILLSLSSFLGDAVIYLDVPEKNARAKAIAEKLGMEKTFETARMYTGPDPEVDIDRVFGVTTFELG